MKIALIKNLAKLMEQASMEEIIAVEAIRNFVESARAICEEVKYGVCSQEDFPLLWGTLIDCLPGISNMELKRLIEDFGFHVDGGEVVNGEVIPMKVWMKADLCKRSKQCKRNNKQL